MKRFSIFAFLLFLVCFLPAFAQPSDAAIRAKLTDSNTLSVKLIGTGLRTWNDAFGNWEWRRSAEVIRKSTQYNGLKVTMHGTAVYQYTGAGNYAYKEFYVSRTQYEGIPDPKESEVMAMINTDRAKFFGYYYAKITTLIEGPILIPEFNWESPLKVDFKMRVKSEQVASNVKLETVEQLYAVRFFRDDTKSAWKTFISTFGERKVLSDRTLNAEEIRNLPTLASIEAEQQALQRMSSLPQIAIPAFKDAYEAAAFVYTQIRTGTPESLEAVLRQMLGTAYFVQGSTTQLNGMGERVVRETAQKAYQGTHKFKNQYCANPVVDVQRTKSSRNRVYFLGVVNNLSSQVAFELGGGRYVDGQKVDQVWKITDLQVYLRDQPDVREFINSFSDWKKLCPND